MSAAADNGASATSTPYEFRVDGHLDDHWAGWLGGLTLTRGDDGTFAHRRPEVAFEHPDGSARVVRIRMTRDE